jgi:hypothetical protein
MMFGLFVSLGLLGLSAVDPIGIAAMLILLAQKRPFLRSFTFLSGSYLALIGMGELFARGFGVRILDFDDTYKWLVPAVEIGAGLLLLGVAGHLLWRVKKQRVSTEPSKIITKHLRLGRWQLFIVGAVLVAVQSIVDVVFLIAMVHTGQTDMSPLTLLAAVATYATAALLLQLAVVAAYRITPIKRRRQTLGKIHHLLTRYADQISLIVSLLLGCALLANGILTVIGGPHI